MPEQTLMEQLAAILNVEIIAPIFAWFHEGV